jgi:hypothetical protein
LSVQNAVEWIGTSHRRTMVLGRLKDKWFCRLHEAGNPFVAIAYGESADAAALEAMQEWKDKAK